MDEIMTNEVTMETVKKTVEIIPAATPKVNWRKFGVGVLVVGAIGALAYCIYNKITGHEEEQDDVVNGAEVAKHDFLDEDEEE